MSTRPPTARRNSSRPTPGSADNADLRCPTCRSSRYLRMDVVRCARCHESPPDRIAERVRAVLHARD